MRDVRMRGFRARTSVKDALAMLEARGRTLEAESARVMDAAGRVAAEDVVARVNVPAFARSAMDGFAVLAESTFGASSHAPIELTVVGEARAGEAWSGELARGEALRIATGAPIPLGADAVIMAEVAEENDGRVFVREAIAPSKNVGAIGEDIRDGDAIVRRGRVLRPQDLGVLASAGVDEVAVVRRPSVMILVTGREVLPAGEAPRDAKIVDANGPMLAALARRDGAGDVALNFPGDDPRELEHCFAFCAADVVLVSGGSSVGPEDHAPRMLAQTGALVVHGVAMRPSSPAGFGFLRLLDRSNRGLVDTPVFLLPGNPVSCLCAYEFFAGPTIRALGGRSREWPHRRARLRLASKIVSDLGRTDYVRVAIHDGLVRPIMTSGASILSSTTKADGVVIVEEDREGFGEGEEVDVLLYD